MSPPGARVPALTILSHPDVDRVGQRAILWPADTPEGEALLARRELAFRQPRGNEEPQTLDDPYVSRRPTRITTARFGGIRIDCTRTSTRVIANDDWISEDRVFLGVEVQRGVVLVLSERLSLLLHNVEADHEEEIPAFGMVGESSAMRHLYRRIEQCSTLASPIMVQGDAGTGKMRVTEALHNAAKTAGPYVAPLESPAQPSSVSDLLSQARGGTLVLNAVHRIGEELQRTLLEHWTQGGQNPRLIVTCPDLGSRRQRGPLLESLEWTRVEVPPLSHRRDDVGRLIFHFLSQELRRLDAEARLANPGPYAPPWFPVRLIAALAHYEWPNNVRQLRLVIEQLARDYHDQDQVETFLDLDGFLEGGSESSTTGWGWFDEAASTASASLEPRNPNEAEVLSALRAHRWQAEPAAAQLGIAPEALFATMEKFFNRGPGRKSSR